MTNPANTRARKALAAGTPDGQRERAEQTPRLRKSNFAMLKRALELHRAGRPREAEPLYRAVLRSEPKRLLALLNLSTLLRGAGRLAEACTMAERAVAADPKDPLARFTLGAALRQQRRDKDAIAAYEKALELDPDLLKAWVNLAVSSERIDRAQSLAAQEKVLSIDPDNLIALNLRLKFRLQECDFDAVEAVTGKINQVIGDNVEYLQDWRILANMAYRALFVPVPPPLQRRITDRIDVLQLRSLEEIGRLPPLPGPDPSATKRRLRIGYMTPNFSDHPVGHVTLRLFPAHDRARFEVHSFATKGRAGGDSAYNKHHRRGVDFYHDLGELSHFEMARRIRNLGIDILIDLDGYMETASTAIMAFRPAPVQVYWLGHAGGLGLSFVDYLIADRVVIPPGEEALYRESVVRLPECYHVASPAPIAEVTPNRADCGLPDGAVVFAAFNNPEKINRKIFEAWMKILAAVPESVLWLSEVKGVPAQIETVRRRASAHGIDPSRLVFARRLLRKTDHFARHRQIDLFLDTITLNASTTALDALWAGVPILTVRGNRFANRISNTMLMGVGLPDMIVEDLDAFVAKAVHLACHREDLNAIRERLRKNRESMALFDVGRFARHLESAYETIWARYCRGEAPQTLDVPALPSTKLPTAESGTRTASAPSALQLHLAGAEAREGWKIVAAMPGPVVDVVCDPRSLSEFADDSVDGIYAAWFYQRLKFPEELAAALGAAARVLKPAGTLRLAVPDFQLLCNMMVNPAVPEKGKFSIMATIFGDQSAPERLNRAGLTAEFLAALLKQAGFRTARRVPTFGLFDDMSSARLFGRVTSLNIEATK